MKKFVPRALSLLFVLTMSLGLLASSPAKPTAPATKTPVVKAQTVCVCGAALDRKVFADTAGKRVYFCGTTCRDKFQKSPDKYLKDMEKQGITLEKAPAAKTPAPKTPAKKPAPVADHSDCSKCPSKGACGM